MKKLDASKARKLARSYREPTEINGVFKVVEILSGKFRDSENVLTPDVLAERKLRKGEKVTVELERDADELLEITRVF